MECGRVMGICGHPKTIRRLREELAGDNAKHVNSYIQKARSQHNLVLLIVDDFHVVHTIQRPTSAETSKAIHMATCLIDVHETIPCLPKPSSPHYWPSDLQSKGIINIGRVLDHFSQFLQHYCHQTWLSFLPSDFRCLNIDHIQTSLINLRCAKKVSVKLT